MPKYNRIKLAIPSKKKYGNKWNIPKKEMRA